ARVRRRRRDLRQQRSEGDVYACVGCTRVRLGLAKGGVALEAGAQRLRERQHRARGGKLRGGDRRRSRELAGFGRRRGGRGDRSGRRGTWIGFILSVRGSERN